MDMILLLKISALLLLEASFTYALIGLYLFNKRLSSKNSKNIIRTNYAFAASIMFGQISAPIVMFFLTDESVLRLFFIEATMVVSAIFMYMLGTRWFYAEKYVNENLDLRNKAIESFQISKFAWSHGFPKAFLSKDMKLIRVNERLEHYGFKTGSSIFEYLHDDDENSFRSFVNLCKECSECGDKTRTFRALILDGYISFAFSICPIRDEDDQLMYFSVEMNSVDEVLRKVDAERDLRRRAEEILKLITIDSLLNDTPKSDREIT